MTTINPKITEAVSNATKLLAISAIGLSEDDELHMMFMMYLFSRKIAHERFAKKGMSERVAQALLDDGYAKFKEYQASAGSSESTFAGVKLSYE